MTKIAVFWGCRILTAQYGYEMSVRQVLPKLGIELVDLREASCCGDPVKSMNIFAATYLAARNLALADKTGLKNLLVPCNRCHLNLCEAKRRLNEDKKLQTELKPLLQDEGLELTEDVRIWHTIDLLHDLIKVETIKNRVKKPLKGVRLASHPGCQIIRPSELGRVDDAETPKKLDDLMEALGAETLDYSEKLDCCGAALLFSNPDAALSLAGSKLEAVQAYGVDALVDSCPSCHEMYDAKQEEAGKVIGSKLGLPVVYYTQLLGVAMGIGVEKLGLHLNRSPVHELLEKIH